MLRTSTLILFMVLTATSLKAQEIDSLAGFKWLELYEKSRALQAGREAKFRENQERYQQMKGEVDDYNSLVEVLNQLRKLTELKYKQIQLKYVNHIHDVKLAASIRDLEKQVLEKARKLK